MLVATLLLLAPAGVSAAGAEDSAVRCAALRAVPIPKLRIVATDAIVPSPTWTSPRALVGSTTVRARFCRVQGVIDQEIRFELWLPAPGAWNGRYLGAGNGGDAGFINYPILGRGVTRGFAAASTDSGHLDSDPHWALGHLERLENYGFRAHHWLAVDAKHLIAAYYGTPAHDAYFLGCSGGGAQGMNEAQRYPADYDGIIAGASGYSMAPLSARFLLSALLARNDPQGVLSVADWRRVALAAVKQCDRIDGVADGVIQDPRRCRFDPASTPGLMAAQVRQAKVLLGPLRGADGRELYPGFAPGAAFSASPREVGIATRFFGEWVYQDLHWNPESFEPARDDEAAEDQIAGLSFTNPNLGPLARRGGKLIMYIGWADPIVPAQADIDYYQDVARYLGAQRAQQFLRLYVVPGMTHCMGGSGATLFGQAFEPDPPVEDASHDVLTAMIDWVEHARAPGALVAAHVEGEAVKFTRPLCPYPRLAHYRGGDVNEARSFRCE